MYRTQTTRMPTRMHHVGYSRRGLGGGPAAAFLQGLSQEPGSHASRALTQPVKDEDKQSSRSGALTFGWAGKKMMMVFVAVAMAGGLWHYKDLLMLANGDVSRDEQVRVAIASGDDNSAVEWLKDGANVEGHDQTGFTPLMSACLKGDLNMVRELLARGADPNATTGHGWSVLCSAAADGNAEIMRLLLANGAKVNLIPPAGNSPLYLSVVYEHEEVAMLLLESGADPNGCIAQGAGRAPLVEAADTGQLRVVRRLLAAGASVNLPDSDGRTAIAAAEDKGNNRVITVLRNAGATPRVASAAAHARRKMVTHVQRS